MLDVNKFDNLLNTRQTASVTEANQNFSKVARMADQEGAVVLLKNNRPKYLLIDIDQINRETKSFSPDEFMATFQEEGIWILRDANEGVKRYIKSRYPDNYAEEIKKHEAVEKFLKVDNDLVVITINHEEGAGVFKIPLDEVQLSQDGEGVLTCSYDPTRGETVISIADYGKAVEKTIQTLSGKSLKTRTDEPDFISFNQALMATGYISAKEIETYSELSVRNSLPLVRATYLN